jgi:uncharacterized protein
MRIVWDEPKRERNLRERRLDFADLPIEFFATATITGARQGRVKATGAFHDVMLTVIFKPLGTEAISIISMRRASRNERKIHGKS